MSSLLFIFLYCICLIAPGLAIQRLLSLRFDRYLASISISYSIFSLAFIVCNHYSVSAASFALGYLLLCLCSVSYLVIAYSRSWDLHKAGLAYLKPLLTILAVSAIYQLLFGSFTEVPADMYAHLEYYQRALRSLDANSLGRALEWKSLLLQKSDVFYYFVAGVNSLVQLPIQDTISTIDFLNRSLFIIAVFYFARLVFKDSANSTLIAALCCVFVAMHMGINVFAYIRYYTLAPTMLNMVLYMFAITVFIEIVCNGASAKNNLAEKSLAETSIGYAIIIPIGIAASTIHIQEAMFIGVMIVIMSFIATTDKLLPSRLHIQLHHLHVSKHQVMTISFLALISFITLYVYSQLNLTRAPNAHWRLWEFAPSYGFFPSITTLNLKLHFSRVLTLWGLLIYLLFFLNFNRYRNNLFILAGMLSPIFTILNPFFIDLFLRHYSSTTVWRLSYLIPIHFVAGDLFIHYIKTFRERSSLKKVVVSLLLIAMIGLLLPIGNTWKKLHYSRFPSLAQSNEQLSHTNFEDLINALVSIEPKHKILTDPMTGYMISALTKHTSSRQKFFRSRNFKHFTFLDYSDKPLRKYKNYLLIVNKREAIRSRIGKLSGHWTDKQWLSIESYYTPALLAHLGNNQGQFELLWSQNDIQIYKIL